MRSIYSNANLSIPHFLSKTLNLLVSTMLALTANSAFAEDFIFVKEAPTINAQVAVVPFSGTPDIITKVIANDLQYQKKSTISTNLPEQPHSNSEVHLDTWQRFGIPYIVVGNNVSVGSNGRVNFEVIDINKGQNLGRASQTIRSDSNAQIIQGHKIADKVYEFMTGVKGDFSGKIAYILENGNGKNKISRLMVMETDGANPTVLYEVRGAITSLSASHDGRKLAFGVVANGYPNVNVIDINSKALTNITPFKANSTSAAFSSDDSQLLVATDKDDLLNPDIYLTSSSGGAFQRLTSSPTSDISPSWSPDSKSFYYVSDPAGNNRPQIYHYLFATGRAQAIQSTGAYNADVHISNDGKKMGYLSSTRQGAVRDLVSGSTIATNNYGLDEAPNFSPNSQHILYSAGRSVVITANGMTSSVSPVGGINGTIRKPVWLKATE